jgi:hypothetical protein
LRLEGTLEKDSLKGDLVAVMDFPEGGYNPSDMTVEGTFSLTKVKD